MRAVAASLTAVVATAAAVSGCVTSPRPTAAPGAALAGLGPALSVEQARRELDRLPVSPEVSLHEYRRDLFGQRWADTDGNGCRQRADVLFRDALPGSVTVRRRGACAYDVLAGRWQDPYSGALLRLTEAKNPDQAELVPVDHVVPLAEAYRSGAATWTARRRLLFANDERNLVAVLAPSNRAKADIDPAGWLPQPSARCVYASVWVDVKRRSGLSIDTDERVALLQVLASC